MNGTWEETRGVTRSWGFPFSNVSARINLGIRAPPAFRLSARGSARHPAMEGGSRGGEAEGGVVEADTAGAVGAEDMTEVAEVTEMILTVRDLVTISMVLRVECDAWRMIAMIMDPTEKVTDHV